MGVMGAGLPLSSWRSEQAPGAAGPPPGPLSIPQVSTLSVPSSWMQEHASLICWGRADRGSHCRHLLLTVPEAEAQGQGTR